ncbi:MAG: hypothetical protein AMXMBFR7_01270 [Planctomycetota bacterium]
MFGAAQVERRDGRLGVHLDDNLESVPCFAGSNGTISKLAQKSFVGWGRVISHYGQHKALLLLDPRAHVLKDLARHNPPQQAQEQAKESDKGERDLRG